VTRIFSLLRARNCWSKRFLWWSTTFRSLIWSIWVLDFCASQDEKLNRGEERHMELGRHQSWWDPSCRQKFIISSSHCWSCFLEPRARKGEAGRRFCWTFSWQSLHLEDNSRTKLSIEIRFFRSTFHKMALGARRLEAVWRSVTVTMRLFHFSILSSICLHIFDNPIFYFLQTIRIVLVEKWQF
jgi:hypothetical protein